MNSLEQQLWNLWNEMEKLTIQAGVSESKYVSYIKDINNYTDNELLLAINWLTIIKNKEYAEYKRIWLLLDPEVWKRYNDYGVSDLLEQRLLRKAALELRKAWIGPYRTEVQLKRLSQKKAL